MNARILRGATIAAAVAFAAVACSGTVEVAPDPTPEPTLTDYQVTTLALATVWADTSAEDQDTICWGWNVMGEDWSMQQLNQDGDLDDQAIIDFFDGVC